jgi:hypothetical protein
MYFISGIIAGLLIWILIELRKSSELLRQNTLHTLETKNHIEQMKIDNKEIQKASNPLEKRHFK